MVAFGIPCRLFVSSCLLSDPLATTAGVFTHTDISAKTRGSMGDPKAGNLSGVPVGSLRASILTQLLYGAAGSRLLLLHRASELWGNDKNQTHKHVSQLHLVGKQKAVKCGRACTASVTGLLVCLGHSDIWGELIGF